MTHQCLLSIRRKIKYNIGIHEAAFTLFQSGESMGKPTNLSTGAKPRVASEVLKMLGSLVGAIIVFYGSVVIAVVLLQVLVAPWLAPLLGASTFNALLPFMAGLGAGAIMILVESLNQSRKRRTRISAREQVARAHAELFAGLDRDLDTLLPKARVHP